MRIEFKDLKSVQLFIQKNKLHPIIWGAGFLGRQWGFQFLADRGIDVEFYCDSDNSFWGKMINGRRVISVDELEKFGKDAFVFLIMGHFNALNVSHELGKKGIENKMTYTELLDMEDVFYDYFPFMKDNKVAVYTCISGDYDEVKMHEFVADNWDMYVITDNSRNSIYGYNLIKIQDCVPAEIVDPTRQNRYCKLHPHKIFPDYKYSIYYDANVTFIDDLSFVFDELPTTRLAVASRLFVDSVYKEAIRLINSRRDDPELITNQIRNYWIQGMPDNFGQYWNYVLVREHNNPSCVKLMEDWWQELEKYSKRDQLSLPYVIWKNGYVFSDVGIVDGNNKYWKRNNSHKMGDSRV